MVATECGEVRRGRGAGLWSVLGCGVVVELDDVVDVAARAGRVHQGNTQVRSRRTTCSRIRSGMAYAGVDSSVVRSMTGLMVILVRESPHQSLTWSSRISRWPSSRRPVGPKTVCSPTVVASKWAWSDDLPGDRESVLVLRPRSDLGWNRSRAVWVRARSPRALARRTSRVSVGPECFLRRGAVDEGVVEVEGVGEVEVGLDVQGAGVVDVVLVDRDVAGVDVQVAVLGIRRRVGGGEVEAFDGLGDEAVELRGADASGDGRHLGVDPARRPRR